MFLCFKSGDRTHRLGSTAFPFALLISFFIATGPMFCRWSAVGLVMMVSQMTASLVRTVRLAAPASGHVADTYTKICLVFQWKSDEKSAWRENRIDAYSSFFVE